MAKLWLDWRFNVALCCLAWGLWGVLGKYAVARLGWPTTAALGAVSSLAVILLATGPAIRWPGALAAWPAVAFGACGALGLLFLTRALASGPASLVYPLAEGYLVITVLLAVVWLRESLDLGHLAGMALMLAGAMLLGRA